MVAFFVMCYAYILYSKSIDRYYIGSTCDDLNERKRGKEAPGIDDVTRGGLYMPVSFTPFRTQSGGFNRHK
jgi:hypothetical protein